MARKRRGGGRRRGVTLGDVLVAAPAIAGTAATIAIIAVQAKHFSGFGNIRWNAPAGGHLFEGRPGLLGSEAVKTLTPVTVGLIGSAVAQKIRAKEPKAVKKILAVKIL